MIRLDTQPEAVDKAYAKSLYELAEERGGRELLEELSGEFDELIELLRSHPRFEEFVASRIIGADRKQASLEKVFRGRISDLILNLALLMNRKGRLDRLGRVGMAYQRLVEEQFGRVEVDVWTKFAIPEDQEDWLRNRLRDVLKREPVIHKRQDSSMLGGMKLRVGDVLLDASYDSRLRKMREMLKTEGAVLMRDRASRAFEGKMTE